MDLIRREDIKNLIHKVDTATIWIVDIDRCIAACPAVDVVEVVRCENCAFWNKRYFDDGRSYGTFCDDLRRATAPGFFCGHGTRREDGDA